MMTPPGPWVPDLSRPCDAWDALETLLAMIVEAVDLELDISVGGFDPALSGLQSDAEMLWSSASAVLYRLVQDTHTSEPCASIVRHLYGLVISDGTAPRQDRQDFSGLAEFARSPTLPNKVRARLSHAAFLMSQVFAHPDPIDITVPSSPFPLHPKDFDIQHLFFSPLPPQHPDR